MTKNHGTQPEKPQIPTRNCRKSHSAARGKEKEKPGHEVRKVRNVDSGRKPRK